MPEQPGAGTEGSVTPTHGWVALHYRPPGMVLGLAALVEFLLVVTATAKLFDPRPAAGALGQVGIRLPLPAVRLGAAAELVAAVGALALGWPVFAAGAALCYTVFAAFVAVALRQPEPVSSCGCFRQPKTPTAGGADTPPTWGHLAYDLAAVAICLAATLRPSPGLISGLARQPLLGAPLLAWAAIGCWLSWMLLSVAPQTAAAAAAAAGGRANGRAGDGR